MKEKSEDTRRRQAASLRKTNAKKRKARILSARAAQRRAKRLRLDVEGL